LNTQRKNLSVLALALLGAASLFAQSASSKPDAKVHVMIVGTYHMNNPGRDMYNVTADDVLTPQRQKEVAEVIAVLKKFRPTKIMIEASPDGRSQKQYADYLAGNYTLTRNEIDQLGYRLAKELGHKQIYPVDVQYRFRAEEMIAYAKAHGQEPSLNAMFGEAQKAVDAINDHLKHGTILNTLKFMNSSEQVALSQNFYMAAARMNSKDEHPGDDLLTDWYERNIRIFSNIAREAEPGDRVLVLYGSGHLYWLQRDVLDSPDMVLEKFE
jgi:hypothetical protein